MFTTLPWHQWNPGVEMKTEKKEKLEEPFSLVWNIPPSLVSVVRWLTTASAVLPQSRCRNNRHNHNYIASFPPLSLPTS